MIRRVVPWIPAAIWAAVLFYVSSRSDVGLPLQNGLDKVTHFSAFLILGFLLAWATERRALNPLVAVALGLLYGLSDELHQALVPNRTPDFADWVADAFGTIVGVLLLLAIIQRRAARQKAGDPAHSTGS